MERTYTLERVEVYRVTINRTVMLCEQAEELMDGYIKVLRNGVWTLLNNNGKTICSGSEVEIYKCKDGMIRVYNGQKYTYISSLTLNMWPFIFDYAEDFENGIAKVKYGGEERYISKAGRFINA